ncbi:MAG: PhnD/SsuA/transferrin family substrate-binding protein, partial [Myxococcota bacterium]
GTPTYLGVLFALRKSPIASLAALRGKTLGLVSSESTSGGLYPQLALLDAGLIPGKDVTLRWLGNHTKVAEAVRDGTVDAGGCYEGCLDPVWPSDADKAASTRLLAYTAEIPSEAIVARRSLDAKVKEAMRRALIATTREAGILGQISEGEKSVTAIVAASDADLAAVGRAMARLREATGQGR